MLPAANTDWPLDVTPLGWFWPQALVESSGVQGGKAQDDRRRAGVPLVGAIPKGGFGDSAMGEIIARVLFAVVFAFLLVPVVCIVTAPYILVREG